jgi:2-haloacid dehalogenase
MWRDGWETMLRDEIPGSVAILRDLRSKGHRLHALTNWSAETFPMIRDTYPVFKEFDGIVVSGEEHLLKPDAAIYRCLLERYALQAEESLFIDDNKDNVEAAKAIGMHAVRFVSAEELEKQLRELGVEI